MKQWTKIAALVSGGAALGAAGIAIGNKLWDRATAKAIARLRSGSSREPQPPFSPSEIAQLPDPVQRYFNFALRPGQPAIQYARLAQTGRFRAGGFDAEWSPFTAVQHFTAGAPGFVWDARIHMGPFVTVRVRDSYAHGVGSMQARVASLIPVVDQSGNPELAAAALHRYLAEAVSLPTALLPGCGVMWEPIDDLSARATLTDCGISVSLDFHFGERGEIVSCYTAKRNRDVRGVAVPTPWACYYSDYMEVDEMMVPRGGETEWILPEGRLAYCGLRQCSIEYNRRPAAPSAAVRALLGAQKFLSRAPRRCCSEQGRGAAFTDSGNNREEVKI